MQLLLRCFFMYPPAPDLSSSLLSTRWRASASAPRNPMVNPSCQLSNAWLGPNQPKMDQGLDCWVDSNFAGFYAFARRSISEAPNWVWTDPLGLPYIWSSKLQTNITISFTLLSMWPSSWPCKSFSLCGCSGIWHQDAALSGIPEPGPVHCLWRQHGMPLLGQCA